MRMTVNAVSTVNLQRTRKGSKMNRGMDYFSINAELDAAWGRSNVAGEDFGTP